MPSCRVKRFGAAALLLPLAAIAAPNGEWLGVQYKLKTRLTSGVSIRMEPRDPGLLAKLSNPGQNLFCAPDECGTVAAAQGLERLPGSYAGVNADNGNWNYDQYDIVSASTRLVSELSLKAGRFRAVVSGIGTFDPVNRDFTEFHGDTRFQPQRTERPRVLEQAIGERLELRQAYVQGKFELWDRGLTLSYGRQSVPWGEGLLVVFNTVNEVNPIDGRAAGTSGFALSELIFPIEMGVLQLQVLDNLNLELVAPTEWRPTQVAPSGSFFSTSDAAGRYGDTPDYLTINLGTANDDPNRQYVADANGAGFISSSQRFNPLLPEAFGHAEPSGEYGARLSWVVDTAGNSVELGAYYLRYHSRLPYFSTFASEASCARDSANLAEATADCRGFRPSDGRNDAVGLEPLPVDTAVAFLDYPRGIELYGLSFNTNFLGLGVSGEYAYRPRLPVQIHVADVIYAALQPSLPRQEITLTPGIPGVREETYIPAVRDSIPDYLSVYRGIEINPGDLIRGYERLSVHQVSVSGLKVLAENQNPFGADQLTVLIEAGAMYIDNLPAPNVLPFLGSGEYTHPSPGRDGSGTADGVGDARRANPHFLDDGLTTRFSAGYRVFLRSQYINLLPNVTLEPSLVFFHDVVGYSPAPLENFKRGRLSAAAGATAKFGDLLETSLSYNLRAGGGKQNFESDRDFASFSISLFF